MILFIFLKYVKRKKKYSLSNYHHPLAEIPHPEIDTHETPGF